MNKIGLFLDSCEKGGIEPALELVARLVGDGDAKGYREQAQRLTPEERDALMLVVGTLMVSTKWFVENERLLRRLGAWR